MDNNGFFDNNGNNAPDENDSQNNEDIFAEETETDNDTSHESESRNAQGQENRNTGWQNQGQQSWNQNRVNPDQWQAYRNSQQGGRNNGYYQQNPYQNYNGYYQQDNSRGFGIASMVLGIISLLCFCSFVNLLPAVLAIVFGIISLSRKKDNGFAIAGIVCGAISVALLVITCVLFAANADLMSAFRNYMSQYGNGFNYYFGN